MSEGHEQSGSTRILEAAIDLFGRQGVAGTPLREVAVEAGVSQALVVHHFGSKAGLRRACDHHVAALVRSAKEASLAKGPQLDPFFALRQFDESRPMLRYLVRTLTDGGEQTQDLVDEFVADAAEYMAHAERAGTIKPSATPRERTIVLVILSMGALTLHEHIHRLLGVDLLSADAPSASLAPYLCPLLELYSQGLFEDGVAASFDASLFDTSSHVASCGTGVDDVPGSTPTDGENDGRFACD